MSLAGHVAPIDARRVSEIPCHRATLPSRSSLNLLLIARRDARKLLHGAQQQRVSAPRGLEKLGAPAFPPDDYDRVLYAAKNASTVWEEAARTGQWDKVDRFCFWLAVFDKVWEW